MRDFVRQQIARLLGRLAFEIHGGARALDVDRVHDLRVAARRLLAALGSFDPFLPHRRARQVRKQLRKLLEAAGAVRDRDIALDLLAATGATDEDALLARLRVERSEAARELAARLRGLEKRGYSARWREALELPR
jgi:CHAD domain-containing protein